QRKQLIAPSVEERIAADEERVDPLLDEAREGRVDLAVAARVLDVEMQPKYACCRLRVARLGLRTWICRVDEEADRSGYRHQLVQQLQPFRREFVAKEAHACDIATRPVEAGNETKFDRVAAGGENDWNGRRRGFGCERSRAAPGRSDHGHLTADQIGCERRQSVILAPRPAVFDVDI